MVVWVCFCTIVSWEITSWTVKGQKPSVFCCKGLWPFPLWFSDLRTATAGHGLGVKAMPSYTFSIWEVSQGPEGAGVTPVGENHDEQASCRHCFSMSCLGGLAAGRDHECNEQIHRSPGWPNHTERGSLPSDLTLPNASLLGHQRWNTVLGNDFK
jgi:hypothetical protein